MTTPAHPAAAPGAAGAAPARRALVIDDEVTIRVAIRRSLQRDGWTVDEAEDGVRALAMLLGPDGGAYDAVLLDLRVPGVRGDEIFDRVRAERPALGRRIVLITGDSVSAEVSAFLARTRCPVLDKPFELAELRAMVARVASA